jgi:hypothetical protein
MGGEELAGTLGEDVEGGEDREAYAEGQEEVLDGIHSVLFGEERAQERGFVPLHEGSP